MERYVLSSALPVRGVAIGAIGDLIGAVLFVIGIDRGIGWLITLAIVLFVLGSALLVAALLVRIRLRTTVVLDSAGIRIRSGGKAAGTSWSHINDVRTDHRTIYLGLDSATHDQSGAPALKIDSPRGERDPQFGALSNSLAAWLDHDRGYRPLQND